MSMKQTIGISIGTLISILLLLWKIYRAGKNNEERKRLAKQIDKLAKSKQEQAEREKKHIKRIERAVDSQLTADDISGMLSNYPTANKKTNSTKLKKS